MKKNFLKAIQTLLVFSLVFTLTNCGNIDNPLEELSGSGSVPPSVVEEAKVLGEALEAGATVTINYTVGNQSYIAIFQKGDGDTYTLISNEQKTSTTRAMTRGLAQLVTTGDGATVGDKVQLKLVGNKLVLTVKSTNGRSLFEAQMNVDGGEVIVFNTNAGSLDCTIGAVSINEQEKGIKNPEMQSVIIQNSDVSYAVKFSDGDTWANVVDRYKNNESVEITTTTDGYVSIKFSKKIVVEALMTGDFTEDDAETRYNNEYSGSFYLTEGASNTRAMTRAIAPTYVKATDAVGAHDMYRLITAPVALSAVTSELGWIVGSDGKAYKSDSYIPDGTTAVAMIAYVGNASDCANGLAIALEDVSSNTLTWNNSGGNNGDKTAAELCSAWNTSKAVTGGTWRLPSIKDWQYMFIGCGASGSYSDNPSNMSYSGLKDKLSAAGGTALKSGSYCSSPENHPGVDAWYLYFDGSDAHFGTGSESYDGYFVRACLDF